MSKQQRAEKEEEEIEKAFKQLLDDYLASPHGKKTEIIQRAYQFAKNAHKGIRRLSGEPYIVHPIAVAQIVCKDIGLGSTSICAALLHDVVEDTEYTIDDIRDMFGDKIASIVDGLTKISGGVFGAQASLQAENFKKLIITMSEDIRVVLIKIADRLHNMRTLDAQPTEKQYKIAGETEYIYAPLAHRLGLFEIKTELENLTFKYNSPQEYNFIQQRLEAEKAHNIQIYDNFALPIMNKLNAYGIQFVMKQRIKSAYSIWKKMHKKHIPFEEIFDIVGSRIVFTPNPGANEREETWKIYNIITQIYTPHPDRIRDWISTPKANGYEALHVTVMGPDGCWIEVQIRSKRMDDIAEKGVAAHWNYKEDYSASESRIEEWLNTINDLLKKPDSDAMEFLDTFKLALYDSELTIFNTKGEMKTMPKGSTVLDFAFETDDETGHHCMAAKVNGKLVPVSYELHSGDQVEVIVSKQKEPSPEYLSFVSSPNAKARITQILKENEEADIKKGRNLLTSAIDSHVQKTKIDLTEQNIKKLLAFYGYNNFDTMLLDIARNNIDISDVADAFKQKKNVFSLNFWTPKIFKSKKDAETKETVEISVDEQSDNSLLEDDSFLIADCCKPVPGDKIIGFKTDSGKVIIHRIDCAIATREKSKNGTNIVTIDWTNKSRKFFPVLLEIKGINRTRILLEITYVISEQLNLDINSITMNTTDGIFEINVSVMVHNTQMVERLCSEIQKIEGVDKISRVEDYSL